MLEVHESFVTCKCGVIHMVSKAKFFILMYENQAWNLISVFKWFNYN